MTKHLFEQIPSIFFVSAPLLVFSVFNKSFEFSSELGKKDDASCHTNNQTCTTRVDLFGCVEVN